MATLRVPDVVPSPSQDAEALKKAFKGWGTDEKAVIMILGHRNAIQRRKIKDAYQQLCNQSLIDSLHSELSGDFGKAVKLWMYDPPERDAKLIKGALKKQQKGSKHLETIVEIACSSSPHHLVAVRQAYCSLFDCSIEEDIASNALLSPPIKKLLVALVTSYRYDQEMVDINTAGLEAAKLYEAIETKKVHQDHFIWIISTRNVVQLRETFERYKQTYGCHISESLKNCGDDNLESLVRTAIWCIDSPEKHFAKVVRESIVGFGTDEDSLSRVIVTRAEVDLMKIRGEYFNMYKTSLDNSVVDDTSGDYKDFLMTLLGAKI